MSVGEGRLSGSPLRLPFGCASLSRLDQLLSQDLIAGESSRQESSRFALKQSRKEKIFRRGEELAS